MNIAIILSMKKQVMIPLFIMFILFFVNFPLPAQESEVDTVTTIADSTGRDATKATLYSVFIPGGGQIYNKKYVKAGVDIGTELTLLGFGIYYSTKMHDAYDRYQNSQDDIDYNEYTNFYNKRQNMIWWFAAVKFLSVVDAFVDAKLFNYELKKRQLNIRLEKSGLVINYQF